MHGMGDNLHQRAVVRQLSENYTVFLETSWPQIYHDLIDVLPIDKRTDLRTQAKNAEVSAFYNGPLPNSYALDLIKVNYDGSKGSVLNSMMDNTGTDFERQDFSLPIPSEWYSKTPLIDKNKPLLIYRPLVVRKEFGSGRKRNPDAKHYYDLFQAIRDDYFVISVADIDDENEWIVSYPVDADLAFHAGELKFEALAALFKLADLVYTSPGFATILAKAVGTPAITVFGNYEDSKSFSAGDTPACMIDTQDRCRHFAEPCECSKLIDMDEAHAKLKQFLNNLGSDSPLLQQVRNQPQP